jgi:hypothetical protein
MISAFEPAPLTPVAFMKTPNISFSSKNQPSAHPLAQHARFAVPALFGGLGLVLALAFAGCHQVLAPFARAFGSPPESELALCRAAFQQLHARLENSRVQVEPVYFALDHNRVWRGPWARQLVRAAGSQTKARFEVAPGAPAVRSTTFGHNQLRYLWERSAAYADWIKTTRPAVDYVWCVEVFGHQGKVGAIQVYVFDANGQVAYCRLFNSHHFGNNLPLDGDELFQLVVTTLFRDLRLDPTVIFPPDGVG